MFIRLIVWEGGGGERGEKWGGKCKTKQHQLLLLLLLLLLSPPLLLLLLLLQLLLLKKKRGNVEKERERENYWNRIGSIYPVSALGIIRRATPGEYGVRMAH